jgi:hypothetical protein
VQRNCQVQTWQIIMKLVDSMNDPNLHTIQTQKILL